jgi:UDP-N-acetyl-D-glucosamine dehydrogenase
MKLSAPIQGWDIRNGVVPALIVGAISALLALAAVLSQPPLFQAGIRILNTGSLSADEAEALAATPEVVIAAISLPAVSGYNLSEENFLHGSSVEEPLDAVKESPGGANLILYVRDTDPDRASGRALAWAQAFCAALEEKTSSPDPVCSESVPVPSARTDNFLLWKIFTAALLGSAIAYGGGFLQARWNAKENASMAKKEMVKSKGADTAQNLIRKFRSGKARVGVIGLGYVGLPLVDVFGRAGYSVVGIDVDPRKIEAIRKGKSYIEDIHSSHVASLVRKGALRATTDFSQVETLDALSICVPTPLRKTGDPDLSFIVNVTEEISKHLHPGMVIVLESTTYPGTTRELLLPKIEERGLKVGKDIFLAFSPERVDPGREDWTTVNTPKVIGGITPACLEVARAYYGRAIKNLVPVSSADAAEMSKLLENTFRAVNIGLVNEVAIMCDHLGLDVWEIIGAAATKPFGFMKFTPGPGLGGHCIPIDPLYLSWKLKSVNYNARFIELASEINTNMPRYVVGKIQDALNKHRKAINGSRILVLGVAYKPNVSDLRESPALDVIGLLRQKGAVVDYHDPYVPEVRHESFQLKSVPDLEGAVQQADCVVITTDHDAYQWKKILALARLVVDTRNALGEDGKASPKVVRL